MTTAREETTRLADLLRREHHALAAFLIALSAFDRARRWNDLGYKALFPFLVRELGLSEGAAFYRKTAAELIQRFPEVVEPLRDGRLCYSSIVELAKSMTPENRAEVLPRFFHVSKREAKAITAELRPAAVVPQRTVVTAVRPAPVAAAAVAPPELHPDEVVQAKSEAPPRQGPLLSCAPPRMTVEPKSAAVSRLHLTVARSLLRKLDQARDALSHSHPGATPDQILEVGLDLILERQAKRRGLVKKPRKVAQQAQAPARAVSEPPASGTVREERSRYVPADVRRAVWERDRGCCQWPIEGGGVCGSTYQAEIDHIGGWAKGAGAMVDELRVLCRGHQDESARRLYGDAVMNRYTRPKGGRCSEPVAPYGPSRRVCSGASPIALGGKVPRRFRSGSVALRRPLHPKVRAPRPASTRVITAERRARGSGRVAAATRTAPLLERRRLWAGRGPLRRSGAASLRRALLYGDARRAGRGLSAAAEPHRCERGRSQDVSRGAAGVTTLVR